IRKEASELGKEVSMLLDTQGREIRTKTFVGGKATLDRNEIVYVTMKDIEGTKERFTETYKRLINDVEIGAIMSVDDGIIQLEVLEIDHEAEEIKTRVVNSGEIKDKKGVNVPNVHVNLPSLTDKDVNDIIFGIEQNVDFIAASFVREAKDVLTI